MEDKAILKINNLCFSYTSGMEILKNINLSVFRNEFIVIAGLNGSGKTTLMNILCGLLRPCAGDITLNQKNYSKMNLAEIAEEIGYVMQECDSQLFMPSVYSEVASCIRSNNEKEKQENAENLLKITGLQDKRDIFPLELNKTDRFKTVFASVLAMGSKLLLLDEPFAGQDNRGCRIIIDILNNARKDGYTILLVTHNINIVAEYAERFILLDKGEIILDGALQKVLPGIVPSHTNILSHNLRDKIPLEKDFFSPLHLVEELVKLKRKKHEKKNIKSR